MIVKKVWLLVVLDVDNNVKIQLPLGKQFSIQREEDEVWVEFNQVEYLLPQDNVHLADAIAPFFKPK